MPLFKSKSKSAPKDDTMAPQKQSVAMAYDLMKHARKRKMAQGGEVKAGDVSDHPSDSEDRSNTLFDGSAEAIDPYQKELDEDADSDDIVGRIMRKMRRK